jgi:hypothetical protein
MLRPPAQTLSQVASFKNSEFTRWRELGCHMVMATGDVTDCASGARSYENMGAIADQNLFSRHGHFPAEPI